MPAVDSGFKSRVYGLVAQIPRGRVMTYGQIAALCGSPRAARIVGGIAHYGAAYLHTAPDCPYAKPTAPPELLAQRGVERSSIPSPYSGYGSVRASRSPSAASKCEGCGGSELPWQRVVHKDGRLAVGYPGGVEGQRQVLEQEGVTVSNHRVDVNKVLWEP